MPDEIETAVFGREPAWHRKGVVVEEDTMVSAVAIEKAGLDWLVEQRPLLTPTLDWSGDEEVPTHKLLIRASDGAHLGVVGKSFVPVQNKVAFEFLDTLLDSGEAVVHTAGSLRGGKRVWIQARLTKEYLVGGDPGERLDPFVLVVNGHDGTMAFTVANTAVRAVCANTVGAGLRKALRTFRVRHSQGLAGKVQEARRVLRLSVGYHDLMAELANTLIAEHYDEDEGEKVLLHSIVVPEPTKKNRLAVKNARHQQEVLLSEWKMVPDLQNIRLTGWGILQAVCRFEDWTRLDMTPREVSDDRRFERVLIEANDRKQRCLSLLAPTWVGRPPKADELMEEEESEWLTAPSA